MIVSAAPQRTPAWYQARAGVLCASDAKKAFATTKDGKPNAESRDLTLQLAVEGITEEPEDTGGGYVNADMQRGIDLEPVAVAAYEAETGDLVERVGFCRHDTVAIGCSPDGFVGADGMLEVKCPRKFNHLLWMRAGVVPADHQLQVLHQLLVTGRKWVDFASYCEGLPAFIPALWVVRYEPTLDARVEYLNRVEKFLEGVERERASLLGWKVLQGGKP